MTVTELFKAAFSSQVFVGSTFQPIVDKVIDGKISPKKTYVQTFDLYTFHPYNADVVFVTTGGDVCYLFEIEF